jgi:hypothetical protein
MVDAPSIPLPEPRKLRDLFIFDEVSAEILVFGQRRAAIDLAGLCRHLDLLVGQKVAAVIVGNHSKESAKEHIVSIRKKNPNTSFDEIIRALRDGEILKGFGVLKLRMQDDPSVPVELEMRNPIIKASAGTGVQFILSYWAAALSILLSETLDITDVTYEDDADLLKCRFAVVGLPGTLV